MSIADKFNILLRVSILPWASSVDKDNTLYSLGAFFFFFFGSFITSPPGGRISFLSLSSQILFSVFCRYMCVYTYVCVHICVCVYVCTWPCYSLSSISYHISQFVLFIYWLFINCLSHSLQTVSSTRTETLMILWHNIYPVPSPGSGTELGSNQYWLNKEQNEWNKI